MSDEKIKAIAEKFLSLDIQSRSLEYRRSFIIGAISRVESQARADEARKCAADVCAECRKGDKPFRYAPSHWHHVMLGFDDRSEECTAADIHERLSLKALEGKEPQ